MTQSQPETVHVVLAVYDPKGTYSQHAGIVMISLFEKTRSPVMVHVLHDDTLTGENRRRFLETAEQYGQKVNLVDVSEHIGRFDPRIIESVRNACSIGTLYRLLIPDLLDVSRVIYLDCDILVNLDIKELWDIDLEGNCIAGVMDFSPGKSARRFSYTAIHAWAMGCRLPQCVNAGVLLMDLDRIRASGNRFADAITPFTRHDQDIVNTMFRGSIKLIDSRFNNRKYEGEIGDSILHIILKLKPWVGLKGFPADALYWQIFARSPWGRDLTKDQLIERLNEAARTCPILHRKTAQCYRKIGSRLRQDLFRENFLSVPWLLLRKAFCSLRECFSRKTPSRD